MNKVLLVTGGLGYIGSHAVVEFEKAGFNTVIVDNLSNSYKVNLDWITEILGYTPDFYEADLRNKVTLSSIFKKYSFDGVLHFAGAKSPFESQDNPLYYYNNNLSAAVNLFDLMNIYEVKNIIFSSSANIYSSGNASPITEKASLGPNNPYGRTKYLIEQILDDLHKFSGFNIVSLRYFNPIGSHKSGLIGEHLEGIPNNIFPYIMKVASGELKKIQVFGGDYDTVDGSGVRDYIDINDLVHGHLLAYEYLLKQKATTNEAFNLGTGRGTSVLQLIRAVETTLETSIAYEIGPRRLGDLAEVYCDTTKAKDILGFTTEHRIEESIKTTWDFYNNRKLRYLI